MAESGTYDWFSFYLTAPSSNNRSLKTLYSFDVALYRSAIYLRGSFAPCSTKYRSSSRISHTPHHAVLITETVDAHGCLSTSHDPKYYPNAADLDKTPETRCVFEDWPPEDYKNKYDSCRRLYFKSMSKIMTMECSGEVFMMTNADLKAGKEVPEDGIWWQVEFPTLFDGNRPSEKKVTKIAYLQVPFLTSERIKALSPEERSKPPKIVGQGEYWPNGPENNYMQRSLSGRAPQRERSLETAETRPISLENDPGFPKLNR